MQQAAFIAGARMTLSSLYKVPDEATRVLMRRSRGRRRWGTKDWAGWVLVGDGR